MKLPWKILVISCHYVEQKLIKIKVLIVNQMRNRGRNSENRTRPLNFTKLSNKDEVSCIWCWICRHSRIWVNIYFLYPWISHGCSLSKENVIKQKTEILIKGILLPIKYFRLNQWQKKIKVNKLATQLWQHFNNICCLHKKFRNTSTTRWPRSGKFKK